MDHIKSENNENKNDRRIYIFGSLIFVMINERFEMNVSC